MLRRNGLWRRHASVISALMVGVLAVSIVTLATAASFAHGLLAPAAPSVTRAQMLARAQSWVDARVPYNQAAWFRGYREDCSGYVSMAWGLSQSYTTFTLHDVANPISKDQLLPGDVLNKRDDVGGSAHVVLFAGWADPGHNTYNAYEENPYWGGAHYTAGIPYPYWPGSYRSIADYMPMRLIGMSGSAVTAGVPSVTAAPPPAPQVSTIYIGDASGTLHALDGQRSRELWRFATGGAVTTIAPANGRVLVAAQGQAVDAQGDRPLVLTTLNAATGLPLWQWRPGCLVAAHAAPLACGVLSEAQGSILVATGSALTAVDAVTGQPRWSYTVGGDLLSGFAMDGTTIYLSHTNPLSANSTSLPDVSRHNTAPAPYATLDAVSLTSGSSLWTAQTAGPVLSGMLVAARGGVYAGVQLAPATSQELEAFDGRTGAALWHVAMGVSALVAPTGSATLYVTSEGTNTGQAASLTALYTRSGQRRWSQPCGASTPLVTVAAVYAVCGGGATVPQVAALDPTTGHMFWQHAVGAGVNALTLVTLADGIVYASATTSIPAAPAPSATATATAPAITTIGATASTGVSQATSTTSVTPVATIATVALDAQAGTVDWQHAGTLLAAGRGVACVAAADGTLSVIAERTGKTAWLFALGTSSAGGQIAIAA